MTGPLSDSTYGSALSSLVLAQLTEKIASRLGLHFPPEKRHEFVRGLEMAREEFGFPSEDATADFLLKSPLSQAQIEKLSSCFTIGETYFFRDPSVFEALRQTILP